MSKIGTQGWLDLTVDDADAARAFYSSVLGWTPNGIQMTDEQGAYEDHVMLAGEAPVGGICNRRGDNHKLPPVWLPYFVVASLETALATALSQGAELIDGRQKMAVVRDPAGAVFALWQGDPED